MSKKTLRRMMAVLMGLAALAAHAAPTVLPWGNATPGFLTVGSDPRAWSTPGYTTATTTPAAFVEGGQQNTPGIVGCANNNYTFNWIPDTSGMQCGFASGGYTVYTAYDGTWLWFGVVVNDATDSTCNFASAVRATTTSPRCAPAALRPHSVTCIWSVPIATRTARLARRPDMAR